MSKIDKFKSKDADFEWQAQEVIHLTRQFMDRIAYLWKVWGSKTHVFQDKPRNKKQT